MSRAMFWLITWSLGIAVLACARPEIEKNLAFPEISTDNSSYEQRQGQYLYQKYCLVCHGEEGGGDGFNAYSLDPRPRDFGDPELMDAYTDERLAEAITFGGSGVNRSAFMPAWGRTLKSYQIGYIVSFIRTFGRSAPQDTSGMVEAGLE